MKKSVFLFYLLVINYIISILYLQYLPYFYNIEKVDLDSVVTIPFILIGIPYYWIGGIYFSIVNISNILNFITSQPSMAIKYPMTWSLFTIVILIILFILFNKKILGVKRKVLISTLAVALCLFATEYFFIGLTTK